MTTDVPAAPVAAPAEGEANYFTVAKGFKSWACTLDHKRIGLMYLWTILSFFLVGGIAALVPERTTDLSAVGPRALLAATLACLMTASVAGTFFNGGSILLGQ